MISNPRLEKAIDVFNVLSFLDEYHVDYVMDGRNIGRDYVGVRPCPGCGDARNHWGIHIEQKFGSCFKCKTYMDTTALVKYYAHFTTYDEAKEFLIDRLDEGDYDIVTRVADIIKMEKKETPYKPPKKDPFPPNCYPITYKVLKRNKYVRNFFKKRKLYLWHVRRYDLQLGGIHSGYKGYLLFPFYYRNKIVTWQARQILSKWYHNPENLGKYIYGEDEIKEGKPLILVEGFLDMIRIDSYLRSKHNDELSVTTGCVKMISKAQIQRIINCKPSKVIVIFDADSWFDYKRIKDEIPIDVTFIILPKGKDPNDLNWNELQDIFHEITQ